MAPRVGINKTAVTRGHDYLTLVGDLASGTLKYLPEERKQRSPEAYFTALTSEQRPQIQSLAIAFSCWLQAQKNDLTGVPTTP